MRLKIWSLYQAARQWLGKYFVDKKGPFFMKVSSDTRTALRSRDGRLHRESATMIMMRRSALPNIDFLTIFRRLKMEV